MDPADRIRVFGTPEEPATLRTLRAGPCSVLIGDGALRGLFWHGTEVLRGIDYPVRDRNWGTFQARTLEESAEEGSSTALYRRRFSAAEGAVIGEFTCSIASEGRVEARLELTASADMEVNRAGLVVLHPVAGFAGTPIRVTHPDGRSEDSHLPTLISPSQPLFDIAALRQSANGVTAEIVFSGEVFEMEDQRNWSDASFKTYCRPLSWPSPFWLRAGETVEQAISIALSGAGAGASGQGEEQGLELGDPTSAPFPEIALAVEAGWTDQSGALAGLEPSASLVRLDLTDPAWPTDLSALLDSVRGQLDLEAIVPDDAQAIAPALEQLLAALGTAKPRSITTLPRAYLKSYQPKATWPSGARPEDAIAAARQIFLEAEIGGGMLTNFTELNRYRGAASTGDFITHGTTAIVHAADDLSVMQTLEALPQIFRSAEALAPEKPYRLGLVSLGMRSNPYGAAVAANPARVRRAMAMDDPRQRGLFGAAWMVGAASAMAGSRVGRVALAAPGGPFGLAAHDGVFPAYHVFQALCRMAGERRLAIRAPQGLAATAVEQGGRLALLVANLTSEPRELHLPEESGFVRLWDSDGAPDWLLRQQRQRGTIIPLGPYDVAFATIGSHDFFGRDFP